MKQKFLKDLGIDIDVATEDLLQQFDLNGFLDQISDNRLKEEDKKIDELQGKSKDNGEKVKKQQGKAKKIGKAKK